MADFEDLEPRIPQADATRLAIISSAQPYAHELMITNPDLPDALMPATELLTALRNAPGKVDELYLLLKRDRPDLLAFCDNRVVVDAKTRTVRCDGRLLDISYGEYDMARLFAENVGVIVEYQEINRMIWPQRKATYNNIAWHVSRLKRGFSPELRSPREGALRSAPGNIGWIAVKSLEDGPSRGSTLSTGQ